MANMATGASVRSAVKGHMFLETLAVKSGQADDTNTS